MKKLAVLLVALASLGAGCSSAADVPPAEPTPLPTSTPDLCMSTCEAAIARVVAAKSAYRDARYLLSDAFIASHFKADTAAVTIAMAELNRAKQAAQNVPVPDCISGLSENLAAYTRARTRSTRNCIYRGDCAQDPLWDEVKKTLDDYEMFLGFANHGCGT